MMQAINYNDEMQAFIKRNEELYNWSCKEDADRCRSSMVWQLSYGFIFFNVGFLHLLFGHPASIVTITSSLAMFILAFVNGANSEKYDNLRSD